VRPVGSKETGRERKRGSVRTGTRASRVLPIAAPLLIIATSLDESSVAEQLFGSVTDVTVLGVFGHPQAAPVVDLRDGGDPGTRRPFTTLSLGRTPGERARTAEIARLIGDAVAASGAATVAIGFGLRGGDHLEAVDAALLARRKARTKVGWIVYLDSGSDVDAGRIARRRMQLFVRGIRLDPVAVAEAPMGANARYWEIRPRDRI
jgi:hypothetical protein